MPDSWNRDKAFRILEKLRRGALDDANHLRENGDDYARSEEDFRLGLTQGMGYDDEAVNDLLKDMAE